MRAAEFIAEAYVSKNSYYGVDRSINPATGKPYIQFGPKGPIDPTSREDERDRYNTSIEYPVNHHGIFPSYKTALRTLKGYNRDGDNYKIVRGGVSKFKIVSRDDPAPEIFGD